MIEEIFHAIVHALEDSILIFPLLLISYLIIEFIENKTTKKFEKSKLLNGKLSPLIASVMGSVPQCGFSVVMTDLFSKQKIAVSTLIAIYLATSDEAVPILLSNGRIADLLILMLTKFILAVVVGYIIMLLTSIFSKKSSLVTITHTDIESESHNNHSSIDLSADTDTLVDVDTKNDSDSHHHHDDEDDNTITPTHLGCCGHHIENTAGEDKIDIMHIIVHSLKVFGFIVAVNIIMNIIIHFVGVDNITAFLNKSSIFQPFISGLVGLIPNCASSIIITELYIVGGLNFGAMVAGLCTNAGIAMVVLFKQNKNIKENIAILISLYLISTIIGMLLSFIPFRF